MGNIVNITYQGGTHGSYLTYCIDRYSELTEPITELPFSGGTSHKQIRDVSKSFINQYHPNQNPKPYFKNQNEPHILVTINEEDLLFIERWSFLFQFESGICRVHSGRVGLVLLGSKSNEDAFG